jgi:hypothetical protein
MYTVSKEELIEESKEIVELNNLKDKLEKLFCHEFADCIIFQEKFNEILFLVESLGKTKNLEVLTLKIYEVSDFLKVLADEYSNLISKEEYKVLISISASLERWGDVWASMSKIDKSLTEKSSLVTLKKWSEWIGLFLDVINFNEEKISLGNLYNLENLAEKIVKVTFITNRTETKKNHYKRFLNNAARLILSKIESNKSIKSWPLIVGKQSYKELVRESQKRIHMLDDLDPKTDEELKEQLDTLEYLQKHL